MRFPVLPSSRERFLYPLPTVAAEPIFPELRGRFQESRARVAAHVFGQSVRKPFAPSQGGAEGGCGGVIPRAAFLPSIRCRFSVSGKGVSFFAGSVSRGHIPRREYYSALSIGIGEKFFRESPRVQVPLPPPMRRPRLYIAFAFFHSPPNVVRHLRRLAFQHFRGAEKSPSHSRFPRRNRALRLRE